MEIKMGELKFKITAAEAEALRKKSFSLEARLEAVFKRISHAASCGKEEVELKLLRSGFSQVLEGELAKQGFKVCWREGRFRNGKGTGKGVFVVRWGEEAEARGEEVGSFGV